jgi:hypothetical protein
MKFQETSMRPIMKSLLLLATLAVSTSGYAGEVTRAMFTIGVDNREPVIMVDSIDSSSYTSISFFTELQDLSGNNITHQWTFNGDVMFEKTFEVKGPRWRRCHVRKDLRSQRAALAHLDQQDPDPFVDRHLDRERARRRPHGLEQQVLRVPIVSPAPKKPPRPIAGFSYVWTIVSDRFVALAKTPLDRPYLVF